MNIEFTSGKKLTIIGFHLINVTQYSDIINPLLMQINLNLLE